MKIGIYFNQIYSHVCLLETEVRVNIISETFLWKEWSEKIQYQSGPKYRSAIRDSILLFGIVLFSVCIVDLHVKVRFTLVKNLSTDELLGTPSVDQFIHGIFPQKKKNHTMACRIGTHTDKAVR